MKKGAKIISVAFYLTILIVAVGFGVFKGNTFSDVFVTKASAEEICGECGAIEDEENGLFYHITWTYDTNTCTLTINGAGRMVDYYQDYGDFGHSPWYDYRNVIETVIISDGVTNIGNAAFSNINSLSEIYIPDSVTSIGEHAFEGCTNLESITLPSNLTYIGYYAFAYCTNLTSISVPENVTNIVGSFLCGCTGITSISVSEGNTVYHSSGNCIIQTESGTLISGCKNSTIPVDGSVTNIGYNAFNSCIGLKNITIPDSVTNIDDNAFYNCIELKNLALGNSVKRIGANAFYNCYNLSDIVLPDSVISIGNGAFYGCSSITSVIIPDTVLSIGRHIFSDSTDIYIRADSPAANDLEQQFISPSNPDYRIMFVSEESSKSIRLTDYLGTDININIPTYIDGIIVSCIGNYVFDNRSDIISVNIPDSIKCIGDCAFDSCTELKNIIIPNGVITIGDYAFRGCSGLTEITIPDGITFIPYAAFFNCTGLENVILGDHITQISDYAFYGCLGLTEVIIPDSVTSIGRYAFPNSTNIVINALSPAAVGLNGFISPENQNYKIKIAISGSNKSLEIVKYLGLENEVIIPDNIEEIRITTIGSSAFSGCSGMSRLTIPDSLTSIGSSAFYNCTGLTDLIIPGCVLSIGNNAFFGITNVIYSGNATGSPWGARVVNGFSEGALIFSNSDKKILCACSENATEVYIPESVTNIGGKAFYGCSEITSIVIPQNVSSIGEDAFYGCTGLKTVYYNAVDAVANGTVGTYTSKEYPPFAFSAVETVYIGESVTRLPDRIFSLCPFLKKVFFPDVIMSISEKLFYIGDVSYREGYCAEHIAELYEGYELTESSPVMYVYEGSFAYNFAIMNNFYYALYDDSGVEFTIKNGVLSRFSGTTQNIVIPSSVNIIGNDIFKGNDILRNIEIPYSVSVIGAEAFAGCSALESVTIPFTVTGIGRDAFKDTGAKINCYYNSYAYNYAVRNNIPYEVITVSFAQDSLNMASQTVTNLGAAPSVVLASGLPMVFKSADTGIATVDGEGNVTAINPGSTVISVYTETNNYLGKCSVTVTKAEEPCSYAGADKDTAVKGEYITWTVVTSKNVEYIKLTGRYTVDGVNKASSVLYKNTTVSNNVKFTEDENTRTWTITLKANYTGDVDSVSQNYTVYYKSTGESAYKAYNTEPIAINVYATKEAIPATETYTEPFSVVSVIPPENVSVGQYSTITIVTTDDCDKVRIGYDNGGKMKYATYQTTTKNNVSYSDADGLRTWVINYKFATDAAEYTIQGRGPSWNTENGKTFTVTVV